MKILPRNRRAWLRAGLICGGFPLLLACGCCMMTSMPGRSHDGPLPPLTEEEAGLRDRLRAHVNVLAGDIGERNIDHPEALESAALYLEKQLRDMGHLPAAQPYAVSGVSVRNIEAERGGGALAGEILVVGGHYDSVVGSPGANDNATGAAATIEIARRFASLRPARTVRFVLFVNEEPPHFQTDAMGSRVYARRCRERGEQVVGMLSLETMGCYADAPGTQHYPFPFSLFYPDTGNFIGFVGNLSSRRFTRRVVEAFRKHARFPSEGVAAPSWLQGVGWSDHASFWEEGYPAAMATDTAPFRYRHYHSFKDTPDQVDHDRLARVVAGLGRVVEDLAGGGP